jgi:hypothetical protein
LALADNLDQAHRLLVLVPFWPDRDESGSGGSGRGLLVVPLLLACFPGMVQGMTKGS